MTYIEHGLCESLWGRAEWESEISIEEAQVLIERGLEFQGLGTVGKCWAELEVEGLPASPFDPHTPAQPVNENQKISIPTTYLLPSFQYLDRDPTN